MDYSSEEEEEREEVGERSKEVRRPKKVQEDEGRKGARKEGKVAGVAPPENKILCRICGDSAVRSVHLYFQQQKADLDPYRGIYYAK